jgi:hypothetical protein
LAHVDVGGRIQEVAGQLSPTIKVQQTLLNQEIMMMSCGEKWSVKNIIFRRIAEITTMTL